MRPSRAHSAKISSSAIPGPDVLLLQKFLNAQGFLIAQTDPGSRGNETTIFGGRTYRALVRYQKAHALPSTGFLGPITRRTISKLYSESTSGGNASSSPAYKSSSITLSSDDLTETSSSGSLGTNVRSTASYSTGKKYAEFRIHTNGGANNLGVGLVNGAFTIGTDWVGQSGNNSIAYFIGGNVTASRPGYSPQDPSP